MQTTFPSEAKNLNDDLQFRELTGGFDVRKVELSTPTKLVVLVEDRLNEIFARVVLVVEKVAPHRITRLDLGQIPRPAEFSLPHMNEGQLTATLKQKMERDAAAGRFSDAVLVAKNGKTIFAQAYGLADRDLKIPNKLATRFRIGSMNKMFTAVATLQLVQSGALELNEPFAKYLRDYPNKDVASKVTIRDLLTHTGGTGDIFGPEFDAHRLELRTLQDYVTLYGTRGLQFEPGTKWDYSNYGFILLGRVIEKVSGRSYYDYVREHVYAPAGMTSTGSDPEDRTVVNRSVGYTEVGVGKWQSNSDTLPYRGTSAGGGYSTVGDLFRFANALRENKLLHAHYTQMLTTGKVDTPNGRYAFGFEDRRVNGARCFGHGGAAPGMNGDLAICPGSGYVVVVLVNMDPPAASRISDFITNRLPEAVSDVGRCSQLVPCLWTEPVRLTRSLARITQVPLKGRKLAN